MSEAYAWRARARTKITAALPFEDSRRLTGANLFFASPGAVLDVVGEPADERLIAEWRANVQSAATHLGWSQPQTKVRPHRGGVSLAITAPVDQLFLATEINEWALCAALAARDPTRRAPLEAALLAQALDAVANSANPSAARELAAIAPALGQSAAFARFTQLAQRQANPALMSLLRAAAARGLPYTLDEDEVTLGAGAGGRSFALSALAAERSALPAEISAQPAEMPIPWSELHDVPTALVTGSNGKTTTVRLLAACARAQGWHAGYNCTDGVFLDEETLATGDYSGPAGARMVLRDPRAGAALLETARGGILRRGIAVSQADVAVVTNVSSDHFGEYGIDDLAGLADVKLTVAAIVKPGGLLVLNADDALLRERVDALEQRFGRRPPIGWFSASKDPAALAALCAGGASNAGASKGDAHPGDLSTCGVRAGRLYLTHRGAEHDLGDLATMPLTMNGTATYNVANSAGAALAAAGLGIAPAVIAGVLGRFGANPGDNPGRMMRYKHGGATVLVDYAHNPDGLRGFLQVAEALRGDAESTRVPARERNVTRGRLGLLLGHAGNRKDEDIEALAEAAAAFRPDLIVIKENEAQLRGRAPGEVPRILRAALLRAGFPTNALRDAAGEVEAAKLALAWARPGDVLALPLHSLAARNSVAALLGSP